MLIALLACLFAATFLTNASKSVCTPDLDDAISLLQTNIAATVKHSRQSAVRTDGRCGGEFGGAQCDAYSASPCCSSGGWCGISDLHCSGHDYRSDLSPGKFVAHVEKQWAEACSGETPKDSVLIRAICPHCRLGELALVQTVAADTINSHGQVDTCYTKKGTKTSPSSIWRIDVIESGTLKTPKIYWPLTTYGYEQFTGSNVMTRSEATHWAKLMHSVKPTVKHALDIGANVGDTALPISLFATGRTVAFEMLPKNFEVLSFFANLNPALGIDPQNVAAGRADGHIEYSEDSGNGRSFLSFLQSIMQSVRVVEPISFLEKMYGKGFTDDIGFIKIDTEGNDWKIVEALTPFLRRVGPPVLMEWYQPFRTQCGMNGELSDGSKSIFRVVEEAGYLPHHPYSGELLEPEKLPCDPNRYLQEPKDLLLLPGTHLLKHGRLAAQ